MRLKGGSCAEGDGETTSPETTVFTGRCRHGRIDAVSGIGFTAGASTSQPIGVAVDDDGNQVMVLAYTVTGEPDATTIVGFERRTNLVELVEGPLPISDSTGNMTTIPSP